MKSALVTLICTLTVVSYTLGHYVPTNVNDYYTGSSCGCSSAKLSDFEYNIDSPSVAAADDESKDVKYKFDFDVEQPKAAADSDSELKSYGYAIQTPASEPKPDDTKYKFDYALQKPAEEKSDEPEQRTMFTKVDRVTQDKPECACKQGKPCSCGYSPEQCAIHCTARNPPAYTSGYVLPVRYNNGGDYVVYELPQDASTQTLRRTARQLPPFPPASEAFQSLVNGDALRAAADRFRERVSKLTGPVQTGGDAGETKLGAVLDISSLRNRFSERVSSFAEPFVSRASKVVENFTQNLGLPIPALSTRRRREAPTTSKEEHHEMDKRIPMLRVKEYEGIRGKQDDISKYTTTSRVELKTGEQQEATHCHKCGSKLMNSVCKQCGTHQPQYVEYIQGRPVSFYPGAKRPQMTSVSRQAPRYVFDRYGHKYLENNGNLRLIVPQQHQEAIVGDAPNFAGLADILNHNQEVIHQLNPAPGRIMPEPVDIASSAIDLVRDLARREIKRTDDNKPEKRSTVGEYEQPEEEKDKKFERHLPRSMYQVVPMQYEGKDGKLVVKVYSAKNDRTNTEAQQIRDDASTTAGSTDNMAEKSKPTIRKFNKDKKEFEILSFEDYKTSSNEDIRQVLEHLHGKQSW